MTDTAQPLARHRENTDEAPEIAVSGGRSIGPVRQALRAVVTWLCASPASTYVFTPPTHENADARAARIRRAQGAVHDLFEPPDPYDTWRRLW
jgi:hypothetical protein